MVDFVRLFIPDKKIVLHCIFAKPLVFELLKFDLGFDCRWCLSFLFKMQGSHAYALCWVASFMEVAIHGCNIQLGKNQDTIMIFMNAMSEWC